MVITPDRIVKRWRRLSRWISSLSILYKKEQLQSDFHEPILILYRSATNQRSSNPVSTTPPPRFFSAPVFFVFRSPLCLPPSLLLPSGCLCCCRCGNDISRMSDIKESKEGRKRPERHANRLVDDGTDALFERQLSLAMRRSVREVKAGFVRDGNESFGEESKHSGLLSCSIQNFDCAFMHVRDACQVALVELHLPLPCLRLVVQQHRLFHLAL